MKFEILISSIVLLSFSACDQPNGQNSNPERKIVRELSQRRIVMLGDFAHDFPLPFHTLTSALSTWLAMLERGESDQNNLTLFLEEDRQVADLITQYLKSGDMNPLLDFTLPSTSIERLEFYRDLRGITERIDSINATSPPPRQISFDVQGPEAINVFDAPMVDSSQRAGILYYVKTRDSLAAVNVIAYLKEHPLQKALVFYGNGHLIKRIVTKDTWGMLDSAERKGKYLAWYLKNEYGDDQVLTISQLPHGSLPGGIEELGKSNTFVPSEQVPWKGLQLENEDLMPGNFDAFVVRHEPMTPRHPLSKVFSRRTIAACVRRMELMEPHLAGAMGKRYYEQAYEALVFLTDTSFSKARDWKSWWAGHPFDVCGRLMSTAFQKQFADAYYQKFDPKHLQDLEDLGFGPRFGNPRTMTRQEWGEALERIWPEIVFLNCVGICWIGDTDETGKAREFLREASGQILDYPDQYLKWWRKQYLNVPY